MASDLIQLVSVFLDLAALDPVWAEGALEYGLQNVLEARGRQFYRTDQAHLKFGDKTSQELIRHKVFPDASQVDFLIAQTLSLEVSDKDVKDEPEPWSLIASFQNLLKAASEASGTTMEETKRRIEADGISIEQMIASIRIEHESDRVVELQQPNLRRAMLRRYLHKLDHIVSQIERFSVLPMTWASVPAHLQTLLSNAHEAALLGQEVACAIVCGTALEEALKICLGRDRFEGIANGIKTAVQEGLFIRKSPEEIAAWDIKNVRDEATHDPGSYLATPNRKKRDVLDNTRFVLAHMFAGSR
ncbi:MAG: hypothetical protein ABI177_11175 [Edaphobacter sp.]